MYTITTVTQKYSAYSFDLEYMWATKMTTDEKAITYCFYKKFSKIIQ